MQTTPSTSNNKDNLMDFKVLSRYDDLFTDVFLDNLFLWFNTIKMNNDHRRPRVPNNKILDIIQRNVLEKAKPIDAVTELLAMDYFKHYLAMKNQKQVQEFIQHMKRYLYMYMPNAGYEVGDTRRYGGNGRRVEACLVSTKDWHVGDEMRLLTGMIACLDPKDDAELKKGNRDFSVMWSTRKNCSCLFLGPARFANHDCDSNCKFISLGQNSITFKVLKEIKSGEEITVYYGKHYFGENNCECRCITCENLSMGYFASLDTKRNTPIDMKDEDLGGTRRSTRKRKPALQEDYTTSLVQRRSKRTSIEPQQRHSIDSLEELIGEDAEKMEIDFPLTIKKEQSASPVMRHTPELPPIPVSPTTATTEKMARLKVMSIGFLCGSSDEEETSPVPPAVKDRRVSDCPLLDLLVDAAMDAEYLKSEEKKVSETIKNKSNQITVVVNPDIHRDATQRILLQQQQQQHQQLQHDSPSFMDSSGSKADSAVSLSPRMMTNSVKKEQEEHSWHREIDDELFSKDEFDALGDFLDDVSDLSSVSSTELSNWTTEDDDEADDDDDDSEIEPVGKKPTKKASSPSNAPSIEELTCIACTRPLKKQDISEQVGADMSITNELATWTWSPSAIFTDWRPKRCPRCERHYTIFRQEWPNRKIKTKKHSAIDNLKKSKKNKKPKKRSNTTSKRSSPAATVAAASPTPATATVEEALTPIVFHIQDDPDDLNYIPPSPLSEVVFEDDDSF